MLLPLAGLVVGVLLGLVLKVNVSFEFARYSAVAIVAALDSVLGAVRAELDGVYDNRIFISGFVTNGVVAVTPDLHRRPARGGPLPGGAHHLRAADLQQRGAHPAPLPLDRTNEATKDCGTRSGPGRDRCRHEQGLCPHRRGPAATVGSRSSARAPSRPTGLKKGVVVNIDQTVHSIGQAVEQAERLSGWKIDRAFVSVGGQHVESQNSPGTVAVSGHNREVTREDINRATEVARAVQIPSNREVLHVLPRDFSVDDQEGVKDPLGMSAIRLGVEVHIVTASATAVQNLTKCVIAAGVEDRRARRQLAGRRPRPWRRRPSASSASPSPTSAPARSTSPCSPTARRSTARSCRSAATT